MRLTLSDAALFFSQNVAREGSSRQSVMAYASYPASIVAVVANRLPALMNPCDDRRNTLCAQRSPCANQSGLPFAELSDNSTLSLTHAEAAGLEAQVSLHNVSPSLDRAVQ